MKSYLAIFTGDAASLKKSGWDDLPEAERRAKETAGIEAWGAWMTRNSDAIIYAGGPLGKTKKTSKTGVEDISNAMAGLVVFTAESHDAAARKFIDHPHFTIFPGDGVEIMEVLPIPGREKKRA